MDPIEELTAALLADYQVMHERILAELETLALQLPTLARKARIRRLQALDRDITALTRQADAQAARTVTTTINAVYEIGAYTTATLLAAPPAFTGIDIDAVTHLAQDLYTDLLTATRGVRADTKTLIRELTRHQVMGKLYTGQTAIQAGRDLATELTNRGITAVVYADGRRVPIATYAQMVIRTKTAEAYQEGTLNQGSRLGVDWWEIIDGPGCGLTAHDAGPDANGMIIPLDIARQWPIAHPNCRRATIPRVDITTPSQAAHAAPQGPDAMTRAWETAAATRARTQRQAAVSATPARTSQGLDLTAGVVPAAVARHLARRA